jgi:CheY-like chemotaxis protein
MHVLLVEDSAINRRFIGLALSKAGIRVTNAENGRLGVEKASAGQYDAILMDMQMPVMDGFKAATILRQLGLTTPIIALTGHSSSEDRERCRQAGCTDHLAKPVDAAKLVDTLTRVASAAPLPDLSGESEDFRAELRRIAMDYLPVQRQRIGEMRASLQTGAYPHLADLAHRMKGTAGTVGLPQFTDPAERLETAALSADRQACAAILDEITDLQSQAGAVDSVL